jgi:hypothetical protein
LRDCKSVCLVCFFELNFPDSQHWLFSHEIGIWKGGRGQKGD